MNTFILKYQDFAILSNLANHFWLFGSYHDIRDNSFEIEDQSVEWFQDKYPLYEPFFNMDHLPSVADPEFVYKDEGASVEVVDNVIHNFHDDFFSQTESHFEYLITYIDLWLQRNQSKWEFMEDEGVYMIYFHSIATLWVICKMQRMFGWSGTEYDDDVMLKSSVTHIIQDLVDFEDFSEVYKNSVLDYTTTNYSNDLGLNYQGEDIGIFDEYFWSSAGLMAPLEEDMMYDEFAFGGRVKNPESYEDHEDFTKHYYFLNEQSYDFLDLEGFYPDFFRYYSNVNFEKRLGSILKWNIYSSLFQPLYFLNRMSLRFLYLRNRRNRTFIKWRRDPRAVFYDPQHRGIKYFQKEKHPDYKLKSGFYTYTPRPKVNETKYYIDLNSTSNYPVNNIFNNYFVINNFIRALSSKNSIYNPELSLKNFLKKKD